MFLTAWLALHSGTGAEKRHLPVIAYLDDDAAVTGDQKEQASLDHPVINVRSLTATSKGLFFASSGFGGLRWAGGRGRGGDLVPVLLYITWDEITAWMEKNDK